MSYTLVKTTNSVPLFATFTLISPQPVAECGTSIPPQWPLVAATAVTIWTVGGAKMTAAVAIMKIATVDDRTPGIGCKTTASAATATAAATAAGSGE